MSVNFVGCRSVITRSRIFLHLDGCISVRNGERFVGTWVLTLGVLDSWYQFSGVWRVRDLLFSESWLIGQSGFEPSKNRSARATSLRRCIDSTSFECGPARSSLRPPDCSKLRLKRIYRLSRYTYKYPGGPDHWTKPRNSSLKFPTRDFAELRFCT